MECHVHKYQSTDQLIQIIKAFYKSNDQSMLRNDPKEGLQEIKDILKKNSQRLALRTRKLSHQKAMMIMPSQT